MSIFAVQSDMSVIGGTKTAYQMVMGFWPLKVVVIVVILGRVLPLIFRLIKRAR